jgi:hypothetical protein
VRLLRGPGERRIAGECGGELRQAHACEEIGTLPNKQNKILTDMQNNIRMLILPTSSVIKRD